MILPEDIKQFLFPAPIVYLQPCGINMRCNAKDAENLDETKVSLC